MVNAFLLVAGLLISSLPDATVSVLLKQRSYSNVPCGRKFLYMRHETSQLLAKRIAGGVRSGDGLWPWQVALQLKSRQVCAGSLVDARWIITAGHCFMDQRSSRDPSLWTALLGERASEHSSSIKRHFERERKIRRIIIHPKFYGKIVNGEYAQPIDYDIALVELQTPVTFDKHVYPICLPPLHMKNKPGKTCYITGWGRNGWKGRRSRYLRQAAVPLVSRDECNRKESYDGHVHMTSLCAGYHDGRMDACQSDSGGPLSCMYGGRWYLTGVISWGNKCARPDKYGVYANVQILEPWVKTVITSINRH